MTTWTVEDSATIELDEPISRLRVRLVDGIVDVVASTDPARVEVNDVNGLPVVVRLEDAVLTVGYDDVVWATILGWLQHERRSAVVSIAVPPDCAVELGVVSAAATIAGVSAATSVRSVSGGVILDALSGSVEAETVSGSVESLSLMGDMSSSTVSGDLTIVGGTGNLSGRTVSGTVSADLDPSRDTRVSLNSVSGDIGVRLPAAPSLEVDLTSTSGDVRSALDGLAVTKRPGRTTLTGRLGTGEARLRARTVSGNIALLPGTQA